MELINTKKDKPITIKISLILMINNDIKILNIVIKLPRGKEPTFKLLKNQAEETQKVKKK